MEATHTRPLRFSVSRKPDGCNDKRKKIGEEIANEKEEGSRLVRNYNVMGGGMQEHV